MKSEGKTTTWEHISFNLSHFMTKATAGMFLATIFYFYETEILLPTIYVGAANILFFVWDAFNDPLMGYISDQPNPMWKKWGRRTPWIVIATIPTGLTFFLLYIPPGDPAVNPILVFIWFVVFLFLHEMFYTLSSCNILALYPEKFQSQEERNKNNSIGQLIQRLANVIGTILPLILIIDGDPSSYWKAGLLLVGIGSIIFFLSLPGIKESKIMIDRALQIKEKEPFFSNIKKAMQMKNFRTTVFVTVLNTTFNACLISSTLYWVNFVLMLPQDSQGGTILVAAWFLSVVISIPIWNLVISKIGTKKTMIVGLFSSAVCSLPILFVSSLNGATICMVLLGVTMSASFLSLMLMFADSVDEASLNAKKRMEGLYAGVFVFFDRLGYVIQTLIFTIVHIVTNFNAEADQISSQAKAGILASFSWIPALGLFLAVYLTWKNYNLDDKKMHEIKTRLEELELK